MNIETNIAKIFEESAIELPEDVIAEAHSLLHHREYGIAFELICNQLYETDANIPHTPYVQMATQVSRWSYRQLLGNSWPSWFHEVV